MIYMASTGRSPHFYATNERALEDIKRCAEEDAAATCINALRQVSAEERIDCLEDG